MSEEKKDQYPIDDSLDVIKYAGAVVKGLAEAKADDGKIDSGEVIGVATATLPEATSAVIGSWNVPKELGELSDQEKNQLLAAGMPVILELVKLFAPISKGA